jgi:hypothetical protein
MTSRLYLIAGCSSAAPAVEAESREIKIRQRGKQFTRREPGLENAGFACSIE